MRSLYVQNDCAERRFFASTCSWLPVRQSSLEAWTSSPVFSTRPSCGTPSKLPSRTRALRARPWVLGPFWRLCGSVRRSARRVWHSEAAWHADRVKSLKARRNNDLDSTEAPSAARQRAARSFDSALGTPGQSRTHHSSCGVLCSTTRVNLPVPVRCTFVNAVLPFCHSSSLLRRLGSSSPTAVFFCCGLAVHISSSRHVSTCPTTLLLNC